MVGASAPSKPHGKKDVVSPKENHGVDTGKWENGCWVGKNDSCPSKIDITTLML